MPIPPLSRPPLPHSLQRSGGSALSPDDRAREAEKNAEQRVVSAEKDVEEARRAADRQLDTIRDQYSRREGEETMELDGQMEKHRLQGYERLRDMQRAQANEMSRVKREGEKDLAQLQNFYRDAVYKTERDGAEKFHQISATQGRQLEYEKNTRDSELAMLHEMNLHQQQETKERTEAMTQKLAESSKQEYDRMRSGSVEANLEAEKSFNEAFAHQVATQNEIIMGIGSRANESIRELRKDTALKLAAYSDRQRDPFYRLLDMNVELQDHEDAYVLTATIPEHEQRHVSVTIKGNNVVLSGQRRNEEKIDLGEGRSRGTNAFQSFEETIPISWPVEAKELTRNFDGDQLTVRVPKKNLDNTYHPPAKAQPPRARVERPKFPDNLPLAKAQAEMPAETRDPTATPKKRGSGPLIT